MTVRPAIDFDAVAFAYPKGPEMLFDTVVPAGSLSAVMGPSGSGKSTFFSLIAGFERPQRGRIMLSGDDVTDRAPAARPISMVFQDNNLFAHLDVETNIALGIQPARRPRPEERDRIALALERVGLAGFAKRRPASLSGGERQRVALARALVRHRPVLLLDEPFAALGPKLREDMLALVGDLHAEAGLTTLMISHQPADARAVCDRVIFIENGRIEANETVETMFASRDIPAWNAYLGSEAASKP
jgi:thiamine transport system ATP-binding protein